MKTEHTFSDGKHTWAVRDLWAVTSTLQARRVQLADIEADKLLDSYVWTRDGEWTQALSVREILDHARRIEEADLEYPIILTPEGSVADGVHRIVKALRLGRTSIMAVWLVTMPEPLAHARRLIWASRFFV